MARIRSIKPEFPQSETIGTLSRDARLLFIQLWTLVDDAGRARAASRMLASLLYPYDDDAPRLMDGWLAELERAGCVRLYVADGNTYLDIANWLKHQRIDHPTPSKLPAFRETSRIILEPSQILAPDLGEEMEKEEEGEKKESTTSSWAPAADSGPSAEEQFWALSEPASKKGIIRSRWGQLAKAGGGDFVALLRVARDVLAADAPGPFLGKVIARLREEQAPVALNGTGAFPKDWPGWLCKVALDTGQRPHREGKRWRVGVDLYNDKGEVKGDGWG